MSETKMQAHIRHLGSQSWKGLCTSNYQKSINATEEFLI